MGMRRVVNQDKGERFKPEYPPVSLIGLFRYADSKDITSMVIGIILSAAVGIASPLNTYFFRDQINKLLSPNFKESDAHPILVQFACLGAATLVAAFTASALLDLSSKRQLQRIRLKYFKAVLKQDIPWSDQRSAGELISNLSDCIDTIELGIGKKVGDFFQNLSGFLSGIIIALYIGWKLTLVACCTLPVVAAVFTSFAFVMKFFTKKELLAYAKASSISGEVLTAIRTIVAFGGEQKEIERYSKELHKAEKVGIQKSIAVGGVTGCIGLSIYCAAALIFWYGFKLIDEDNYDAGSVILVFVNVVLGSIFLGNALPTMRYFLSAKIAAQTIYGTIERVPPIDKDADGLIMDNFQGNIQFENVSFVYPTRPEVKILQNFNLTLKSGQTVALVGPSGSGKSTIIHMLQRFYDPEIGNILIEGENIRELNLKAYRAQIGCVQQEPILFEGTIAENIRMGKLDATEEEIKEAAKEANAHEFISKLPDGYNTLVAERGGGMSGGQKQRIAIARALIRKPKLLLLDEATSALDTRSEREVQEALEKASEGRTVVVVAHRLTTVRNADLIMVLEKGYIRESGTHDQLVALDGLYATMLKNQKKSETEDEHEDEFDDQFKPAAQYKVKEEKTPAGIWRIEDQEDLLSETIASELTVGQRISIISQRMKARCSKMRSSPVFRVLRLNRPETGFIIGGCISCVIAGATVPSFAVLYSEVYNVFLMPEGSEKRDKINLICGMMALVGFLRFFALLLQGYFFGVSGERLTRRVRSQYFEAMLRQRMLLHFTSQEIGWFDKSENQPGALTAKLAAEASKLRYISGSEVGTIMEAVVVTVVSWVIAFVYGWQLALVFLVFYPIIVLTGVAQVQQLNRRAGGDTDMKSMRLAQEAISNSRTVTTLILEDFFYEKFNSSSSSNFKKIMKACLLNALMYAVTQSVFMFAFAAVFALGAHLVVEKTLDPPAMFRVFAVMNMSAQTLGRLASVAPDSRKAEQSSRSIFATIDRIPQIQTDEGLIPDCEFKGKVTFKNVYFRYPTRREARILKNFSHTVEPNQTVALVGQSGCGKSTLLQLVQRFYDPSNHGEDSGVYFDEWNLRDLAPSWIRKQIGVVSQEPNLLDMTLRENIAYGDNTREVSTDEIIEAARQANAHDFISALPDGYETLAGASGSQLSGGQKQRIAIARALIRKPKLLLLDEATSALDNESERIVQEALDAATGSRTSIVVAHRLTTVERSDLIVVLDSGRKIEYGPPAALMETKGAFYALHCVEQPS
ncbi:Multidrug resistance protein 2 [Fasciola hepatica]|uniref:Multidrug resistance protein 2 n=2 Tax=Fasciola hepatica TaxID=6192 RepID=A0A4E0RJS6_FASHE|nr:Multidrug resistance protein 2 [Fasciola hepatica]